MGEWILLKPRESVIWDPRIEYTTLDKHTIHITANASYFVLVNYLIVMAHLIYLSSQHTGLIYQQYSTVGDTQEHQQFRQGHTNKPVEHQQN